MKTNYSHSGSAVLFIAFAIWSAYVRNLSKLTEPTLFKQLLCAFPTVWFAMNLVCYYAIWWFLRLTSGPDVTARDIGRMDIFDEFDLVATIVLLILVRLFSGRRTEA